MSEPVRDFQGQRRGSLKINHYYNPWLPDGSLVCDMVGSTGCKSWRLACRVTVVTPRRCGQLRPNAEGSIPTAAGAASRDGTVRRPSGTPPQRADIPMAACGGFANRLALSRGWYYR